MPTIAITMGDVSGIGPEIVAKALLRHPDLYARLRPVVVGDMDAMRAGARLAGASAGCVREIATPAEARGEPGTIDAIQVGDRLPAIEPGRLDARAGNAACQFVVGACDLAKRGQVAGIVTAPLNKAAMHAAGHPWPGHTELLAHEFGVSDFSLVLSAGDLYLFHLTTHVSLRDAISAVTRARAERVLRLAGAFARALGRPDERIGLAGLNPHAGEGGIFGVEDRDELAPAVAAAVARGINVAGPLPADALIPAAVRGEWRIVVVCYHDQGHAPFKAVYGDNGVNITLGLPIVRVSVDHGTAFDIAGSGRAREASLVVACERAAELAPRWGSVWEATRL